MSMTTLTSPEAVPQSAWHVPSSALGPATCELHGQNIRRQGTHATFFLRGPLVAELWPHGRGSGQPLRVLKEFGEPARVELPRCTLTAAQAEHDFFLAFREALHEALRQDEQPWWQRR
jgi:hypothetical protein